MRRREFIAGLALLGLTTVPDYSPCGRRRVEDDVAGFGESFVFEIVFPDRPASHRLGRAREDTSWQYA